MMSGDNNGGASEEGFRSVGAVLARTLVRGAERAVLATAGRAQGGGKGGGGEGGWPYPSLVLAAPDHDGSPLLLLSSLSEHTRQLLLEPRCGLLFADPAAGSDPMAGARVALMGRVERTDNPRHRARYVARHSGAALYAGFGDFACFRLGVERVHVVAGFGRVHWLDGEHYRLPESLCSGFGEEEEALCASLSAQHGAALTRLTRKDTFTSMPAPGVEGAWRITGVDPEGCDLAGEGHRARVAFFQHIASPDHCGPALHAVLDEIPSGGEG